MRLAQLEKEEKRLMGELAGVQRLIMAQKRLKTHVCMWCKKRAQRRSINLHVSTYTVDEVYNQYEADSCCKLQCPHCGNWTRYYADWKKVIESEGFFKSVERGHSDPGHWRNAPGQ